MLYLIIFAAIVTTTVDADCCPSRQFGFGEWKCGDGTLLTGFYCGYNKCNIFGCGCTCRNASNMIPFDTGDVIACYMFRIYYSIFHVMLALNSKEVMHVTGIDNKLDNEGIILRESFKDVIKRKNYTHCQIVTKQMNRVLIHRLHYKLRPIQDMLDIALKYENQTIYYNIDDNNCEHWVTFWKYDINYGRTIQTFRTKHDIAYTLVQPKIYGGLHKLGLIRTRIQIRDEIKSLIGIKED